MDSIEWARQAEELGAGEIVATSVDRDGTGDGYDLEMTRQIADVVSIPVIAHGGPGNATHVSDVISESGVDAVAVASLLHYDAVQHLQASHDTSEGNTEFLRSGRGVSRIESTGLPQLKVVLDEAGVEVRSCEVSA